MFRSDRAVRVFRGDGGHRVAAPGTIVAMTVSLPVDARALPHAGLTAGACRRSGQRRVRRAGSRSRKCASRRAGSGSGPRRNHGDVFLQVASGKASFVTTGRVGWLCCGELHDGTLIHLRAREYDASVGGFTSRDPVNGTDGTTTVANPYPYAGNKPVNMLDPTGKHRIGEDPFNARRGRRRKPGRRFAQAASPSFDVEPSPSPCTGDEQQIVTPGSPSQHRSTGTTRCVPLPPPPPPPPPAGDVNVPWPHPSCVALYQDASRGEFVFNSSLMIWVGSNPGRWWNLTELREAGGHVSEENFNDKASAISQNCPQRVHFAEHVDGKGETFTLAAWCESQIVDQLPGAEWAKDGNGDPIPGELAYVGDHWNDRISSYFVEERLRC